MTRDVEPACRADLVEQFIKEAALMRTHQKAWFKEHKPHDLNMSKHYEARVDRMLRDLTATADMLSGFGGN